jgi:HSP20 family protein
MKIERSELQRFLGSLRHEMDKVFAEKAKQYHRQEIQYGPVRRPVRFPVPVERDKATATVKDGLLQVTVPKSQQAQAKPVKLEVS